MDWEDRTIADSPGGSECCHLWVIEPAEGPLSEGTCQKCGEAKTFTNYIEQHTWNEPQSQNSKTSPATPQI